MPLLIEFSDLPRVTDPATARSLPELAVLSVMAHPELEVVSAAIPAISELPEDRSRLYLDVIIAALPPSVRKLLETRMQGYVYQSDSARKYYSQGREEGREQGLRSAVLALMRAKLDVITTDDEAAIAAVRDERVWTELIGALGRATSALEVRAALAAACLQRA